jgi:hypothetical protein
MRGGHAVGEMGCDGVHTIWWGPAPVEPWRAELMVLCGERGETAIPAACRTCEACLPPCCTGPRQLGWVQMRPSHQRLQLLLGKQLQAAAAACDLRCEESRLTGASHSRSSGQSERTWDAHSDPVASTECLMLQPARAQRLNLRIPGRAASATQPATSCCTERATRGHRPCAAAFSSTSRSSLAALRLRFLLRTTRV